MQPSTDRAALLLCEAENLTRRTSSDQVKKFLIVTEIAEVIALYDPAEALRLAATITYPVLKDTAIAKMAEVVAAYNLALAENLTNLLTEPGKRPIALSAIAVVVAPRNIAEFERLSAEAEQAAAAIESALSRTVALTGIAKVIADRDRAGARRILAEAVAVAQTMESYKRTDSLNKIVEAMAQFDPADAEQLAATIGAPDYVLASIGIAWAASIPEPVELLARRITSPAAAAKVRGKIAAYMKGRGYVHADLAFAQAVALARKETRADLQAAALDEIAVMMAEHDPVGALELAGTIKHANETTPVKARIAMVVARTDPAEAERLANDIGHSYWKAYALAQVATVIARQDPVEAERVARTILAGEGRNEHAHLWQASAFAGIAKTLIERR
ncbi:hypothetical protein ABH931_007470 [Streptacidiphilus sp. MAP12-33]|uniref:hypothetical protein n=1 Tax=Streptacidiphilus sp. MAP12-33 TaxID=3156266 RepID=UPI003519A6E7